MTVHARILVVEAAPPVLDLFREALDRAGFEVDSASTASEAMEVLATRRYAVILADCLLGDLPVLDWLAALRGVAPQTPLILQSGHIGEEELRGYAAEFRAAAVLEKPFSVGQLLAARAGGRGELSRSSLLTSKHATRACQRTNHLTVASLVNN